MSASIFLLASGHPRTHSHKSVYCFTPDNWIEDSYLVGGPASVLVGVVIPSGNQILLKMWRKYTSPRTGSIAAFILLQTLKWNTGQATDTHFLSTCDIFTLHNIAAFLLFEGWTEFTLNDSCQLCIFDLSWECYHFPKTPDVPKLDFSESSLSVSPNNPSQYFHLVKHLYYDMVLLENEERIQNECFMIQKNPDTPGSSFGTCLEIELLTLLAKPDPESRRPKAWHPRILIPFSQTITRSIIIY